MPNGYVQCKGRALCAIIDNYKHVWAWYEAREDYAKRDTNTRPENDTDLQFWGQRQDLRDIRRISRIHDHIQLLSAVVYGAPGARADDSSVIIALQASCELLGLISRCSHLNTMREAKMQQGMGRDINFTFYIRNYPGLSIHTDTGDNCFARVIPCCELSLGSSPPQVSQWLQVTRCHETTSDEDFSVPVTSWRQPSKWDASQGWDSHQSGPDLPNELCLKSEGLMFVTHSYLLAITRWSTVKHVVYMHLPRCHLCGVFWDKSCSWKRSVGMNTRAQWWDSEE